jgi:hypothetical protein
MIAPFPGLPKMIEEADAIAIVSIEGQIPAETTLDHWSSHRCSVLRSRKGDLTEGQHVTLTLFDTRSSFVSPFAPNSTHIAFLSTNGNGAESQIRNLQYESSILRLSPFGHEREPDGWNLERKIKILLERSIAYWDQEQQREKELLLAAITGLSSPLRRELEQAHRSVWDSTQREKSIRITPNVDFDGIIVNAIVSYQPDGKEWTIQINLFAKDRADIEKQTPPTIQVFNPAGALLKVIGYGGYGDIDGILCVMYRVEAESIEEIAEAELEFKGMKRRVMLRSNVDQEARDPKSDNSAASRALDETQIEPFWDALWNVAPKPTPAPLTAKDVQRLHGDWKCRVGVTPDLINVSILPDKKIHISGEKDARSWTRTGEWKIVNDKCVILLNGKPPNFIIRVKDDFFMFDPWATNMLSKLLR